MKRNKKGFTLVELVIVIAVIAILAGVMVAVFSGVIKRANESAELQQVKNDELKQKADDVLTKLDNANWFSWEDFENSLAEKLTSEYKRYASENQPITSDAVEKAVKSALDEFAKNNVSENTSLTEAQVKYIVENAISKASLGGVTEAQVRTIVNTAVADINTVSKSDIQKIVDAATAKGLTADAVAQKIAEAKLASATSVAELSTKIDTVVAALNALTPVTNKDIEDKIIDLLPVTYTANSADEFKTAVGRLNSFSTIYVNFTPAEALEVKTDAVKTLIIKGSVTIDQLEVDAPKATIYLATDAGLVDVKATAQNSFHVASKVTTLNVNSGRVVVEDGAKVETLKAAPSVTTTVKVAIEEEGMVTNLIAEYQKNGNETRDYIVVENNGTVGTAQLKIVAGDAEKTEVTTNVKVINGANAKGTEVDDVKTAVDTAAGETAELLIADEETPAGTLYNVATVQTGETVDLVINNAPETAYLYWIDQHAGEFAGGEGTFADPYEITNGFELARIAYLVNNPETRDDYKDKYYVLTSDVDLSGKCWTPISNLSRKASASLVFAGTFDGQNYTITGLTNNGLRLYEDIETMTNDTTPPNTDGEYSYGLFGTVINANLKNVNFEEVAIKVGMGEQAENGKRYVGDSVGALVGAVRGVSSVENVHVKSGSVQGYDATGGIIGRIEKRSGDVQSGIPSLTLVSCSNAANVTSVRRAGGLVGYRTYTSYADFIFSDCSNSGNIVCLGATSDFVITSYDYYMTGVLTAAANGDYYTINGTKYDLMNVTEVSGFTNTGTLKLIRSDGTEITTTYIYGTYKEQ